MVYTGRNSTIGNWHPAVEEGSISWLTSCTVHSVVVYRNHWSGHRTVDMAFSRPSSLESPDDVAEAYLHPWCLWRKTTVGADSRAVVFTEITNTFNRLIVFIGFRLKYLAPARNWDPTLTSIVPSIFTQAVLHFSIIASCVTTLKPFLRHFDPTYVLESADVSSSKRSRTSTTNPSRDPYYRLGTMNRPNRSRDDPNDNINWRPYQGPTQSDRYAKAYHDSTATQSSQSSKEGTLSRLARTISTSLGSGTQSKQSSATRSNHIGDTASMRTDASDRIIIERTTEVSVEHEDSPAERASRKGGV